jgi:hypothetical protein
VAAAGLQPSVDAFMPAASDVQVVTTGEECLAVIQPSFDRRGLVLSQGDTPRFHTGDRHESTPPSPARVVVSENAIWRPRLSRSNVSLVELKTDGATVKQHNCPSKTRSRD